MWCVHPCPWQGFGTKSLLRSCPRQAVVSFHDSLYQDFARYIVHLTNVPEELFSCSLHYCKSALKGDGGNWLSFLNKARYMSWTHPELKACCAVTDGQESCPAAPCSAGLGPGAQSILSQSETSPGALVREVGAVPAMVLPYGSITPISQPGFMHSSLDCNNDLCQLLYLSRCTMFPWGCVINKMTDRFGWVWNIVIALMSLKCELLKAALFFLCGSLPFSACPAAHGVTFQNWFG